MPEATKKSPRVKILVLSIGSLLGQNVLDVLETRRHLVEVIGLNSVVKNPRNFRCDQFYLVPPLSQDTQFKTQVLNIIEKHQPDIILPGRDDDIVFLAHLREEFPQLEHKIPAGKSSIAEVIRDKHQTYLWAQQHNLPFAKSILYKLGQPFDAIHQFLKTVDFPLICKPPDGFGSNGVYIANDWQQLESLLKHSDFLIQEYLDPPEDLHDFIRAYSLAIPLFFGIPDNRQYAVQTLITPSGRLSEIFCSISQMKMGRGEYLEKIHQPEMVELLERYASQLYQDGWVGFVNLQCRPDRRGVWKAHELNLRMSGGTSCRMQLGYDELGRLIHEFYPQFNFPDLSQDGIEGCVQRNLIDQFIPYQYLQEVEMNKQWKKSL